MSDIQLYLLEYDKNKKEALTIAQQSAEKLEKKELKFVALIESLGEYINHEDGAYRAKSMSYLADVLVSVPPKVLTGQHRNVLCDFLLVRIEDDPASAGHCARGLLALQELGKWDKERATKIMKTTVDNTHPVRKYKSQSDRYALVQLMDLLMAKYREAMQQLHTSTPEFLPQFISYFDGEKDPRNLMVVFSILKVPMTEWDMGNNAQDLFEAVFNYFPITFRPPPDDPYGITAQMLKDRLKDCLASTPTFAAFAFPALLDKLDSTSMNTKRDSMHAIRDCVVNYGPDAVFLYAVTLWDALKFEILNVQDEDLAEESLRALAAIANSLSCGPLGQLHNYLSPISKECNEHLEDAPTKQSQASGRILSSLISASTLSANFLISSVSPHIFALYYTADNIAKRRGLFEVFANMARGNAQVFGQWRIDLSKLSASVTQDGISETNGILLPDNALSKFSDQAILLMAGALETAPLKEVSFRMTMLEGLLNLSIVRGLLSDDDIAKVIGHMCDIIINEEPYGKGESKEAAITSLVEVAHQKPQLVIEKAFPLFMAKLPDKDETESTHYVSVLEAFAKLASEDKTFETVIVRLKNKINIAIHQAASSSYMTSLLSALLYAFTKGASSTEATALERYFNDVARPLLLHMIPTEKLKSPPFADDTVIDIIGRILLVIMRPMDAILQEATLKNVLSISHEAVPEGLPPTIKGTLEQQRSMIITTSLLASLRKETPFPQDPTTLLPTYVAFAQHSDLPPTIRAASLKPISLLVNKLLPNSVLKSVIEPILFSPLNLMSPPQLNPNTIRIIFSIVKGLVLRNSPLLPTIFQSLQSAFSNQTYGTTIARGFATILQPDDILTKENYCTISGLHKQKAFTLLVPNIASKYREASPETRTNCLIASSGLVRWLPYSILEPELASLIPLLLQSLTLTNEDDVKSSAIDTLIVVLHNNPKGIESHASGLVNRLLDATDKSKNPPRVRASALRCLRVVGEGLRTEIVMPLRREVVKRLLSCLDDGKRIVRSEAVKCRGRWMDLGEDEEE